MSAPVLPMIVTMQHADGRDAFDCITLRSGGTGAHSYVTSVRSWGTIRGGKASPADAFEHLSRALARFEQLVAANHALGYRIVESFADSARNAHHRAVLASGVILGTGCWIGRGCYVDTQAVIGRAASIDAGVRIEPFSLIGHQARIACKDIDGPLVTGPNVHVGADAYARGRLLGRDGRKASFSSASVIVHPNGVVDVYVGRGEGKDWQAFKVTDRASLEAIPGCLADDVDDVGELMAKTMHEDRMRHGGAAFQAAMATPGVADWITRWLPSSGSEAPLGLEASLEREGWCESVHAGGQF